MTKAQETAVKKPDQTILAREVNEVIKQETNDEFQKQAQELTQKKLSEYFERREELEKKIDELTKANNKAGLKAAKANLRNIDKQIALRTENMSVLIAQVNQKMKLFSDMGDDILKDTLEDTQRRSDAEQDIVDAEQALQQAQVNLQSAKDSRSGAVSSQEIASSAFDVSKKSRDFADSTLKNLQDRMFVFGRTEKEASAKEVLSSAQDSVKSADKASQEATERVQQIDATIANAPNLLKKLEKVLAEKSEELLSVAEQIQIEKDHRLESLKLDELYATLTGWENKLFKMVERDITDNEGLIKKVGTSLIAKRSLVLESAESLKEVIGLMEKKQTERAAKKEQLSEMDGVVEKTDVEYVALRNEISALSSELDNLNNKKIIKEDNMASIEVSVKELQTTLKTLKTDLLLAQRNYNDLVINAEAARIVGQSIAQIVKNKAGQSIGKSLSESRDAMTLAVISASIEAEAATAGQMADRAGQRVTLLKEVAKRTAEGNSVIAGHAKRHADSRQAYKEQYQDLDLNTPIGSDDGSDKSGEKPVVDDENDSTEKRSLI